MLKSKTTEPPLAAPYSQVNATEFRARSVMSSTILTGASGFVIITPPFPGSE